MASSFDDLSRDGVILDIREEMARRSRPLDRVAHQVGRLLASAWTAAALLVVGLLWMVANSGWIGLWRPWDPYPFPMLATTYSVLGPLLAVLILMRQHHDQQVGELRGEVILQVLMHTEHKITAGLHLLDAQQRGAEPDLDREHLRKLLDDLDAEHLVEVVHRHLEKDEQED